MSNQRFPELDFFRGLAVASMILYHLCFDLAFFYGWDIPVREEIFSVWARGTAMIFLGVMGVCFTISWSRRASTPPRDVILSEAERPEGAERSRRVSRGRACAEPGRSAQHDVFWSAYTYYFYRGLIIFLGGMIIYFVTYLIAPGAAVKFGILHLIGVSAMLQPLLERFGIWNAVIGIAWTAVGIKLTALSTQSVFLFPFGIIYPEFYSLDYYPLFPWFGTVLMGMAIGHIFYVPKRSRSCEQFGALPYPRIMLWMGRRALPLYFVHQPLLFVILVMLLGMPIL